MDFPTPLIFNPIQLPHKQTFILLHGRGSTGDKFGPVLLETPIAPPNASSSKQHTPPAKTETSTLRTLFPHARFIFPTAARHRATIYRRAYTHQWFNNWKLDPPATERQDLQIDGLRETTLYLHDLLRKEIALAPGGDAKNVIFGGLSQGCAVSLVAGLLWEGERLGAWVGMCGWLPFAERLMEHIEPAGAGMKEGDGEGSGNLGGNEDDFDPFGNDDDDDDDDTDRQNPELDTPAARAINWLREELDLPKIKARSSSSSEGPSFPILEMPLFWGHGAQDDRVSILLGRRGWEYLRGMGGQLSTAEYETLGHWYSSEMLRDLTQFLQNKAGLKATD